MSSAGDEARLQNARETIDCMFLPPITRGKLTRKHYTIYHNFYKLVQFPPHTDLGWTDDEGLDKQTLSICVGMIEAGANPDTLAVSSSTSTGGIFMGEGKRELMLGCR